MANLASSQNGLLRYLIFFVTSRCNSRCVTCFYWQEMERAGSDFSLDEIERIAGHLGPLETLLLSGGEPTLRTDLAELVETFFRHNGVRHVGLPTNGLLPERTRDLVEKILTRCPGMRLDVNVSLDDLGERHDAIRGVEGNFDCALETIRLAARLRERFDNLFVNVETVVFSANWQHVCELLDFVRGRLDVNGHYVELMRGNPRDGRLDLPPRSEIHRIHRLVLKNHLRYHGDPRKKRWPHEMPYLYELYRWQERVLRGERWAALCPAACDVAVIESDGRVRGCELRGVIGDLRQCDYDLRRILESPQAATERREIETTRCSCTHCVFIYQAFAVHSLPSERRRRWLERWFAVRRRIAKVLG
jgi:molybdenum cofactor biosynthesis enzyme MoaA